MRTLPASISLDGRQGNSVNKPNTVTPHPCRARHRHHERTGARGRQPIAGRPPLPHLARLRLQSRVRQVLGHCLPTPQDGPVVAACGICIRSTQRDPIMTKTGRNKGPVFMMRHYGANLPRSELGMHTRTMRARLPNGELEYAGHMDQFVLASDYDALQSQLAHLTQQRDGLLLAMGAMHIG